MTPKIKQFLVEKNPPTPFLVLDLDIIKEKYIHLKNILPVADIFYAVKANPALEIIKKLESLGSYFDASSTFEIDLCLKAGVKPEKISYGSTIKKLNEILYAFQCGVRIFAFDSIEELKKIAKSAPGSKVFCRIKTSDKGSDWPLSGKFGCDVDMAKDLLLKSSELKLDPYGVSFHVGSQQRDSQQWKAAIFKSSKIFNDLKKIGLKLRMINLGGGFPVKYSKETPSLEKCTRTILRALDFNFPDGYPRIIVEPGRAIAAEAGLIQTEVVLISKKSYRDNVRWVYLDVGVFSGMIETLNESIKFSIRTQYDGQPESPVIIAGPTCDGIDILYKSKGTMLPQSLREGDKVQILSTGAYSVSYSSVGFNGFPPLKAYYI